MNRKYVVVDYLDPYTNNLIIKKDLKYLEPKEIKPFLINYDGYGYNYDNYYDLYNKDFNTLNYDDDDTFDLNKSINKHYNKLFPQYINLPYKNQIMYFTPFISSNIQTTSNILIISPTYSFTLEIPAQILNAVTNYFYFNTYDNYKVNDIKIRFILNNVDTYIITSKEKLINILVKLDILYSNSIKYYTNNCRYEICSPANNINNINNISFNEMINIINNNNINNNINNNVNNNVNNYSTYILISGLQFSYTLNVNANILQDVQTYIVNNHNDVLNSNAVKIRYINTSGENTIYTSINQLKNILIYLNNKYTSNFNITAYNNNCKNSGCITFASVVNYNMVTLSDIIKQI